MPFFFCDASLPEMIDEEIICNGILDPMLNTINLARYEGEKKTMNLLDGILCLIFCWRGGFPGQSC
jgi:hypothetical protein